METDDLASLRRGGERFPAALIATAAPHDARRAGVQAGP